MVNEIPQYIVRKSMWTLLKLPIVLTTLISIVVIVLGILIFKSWLFLLVLLVPICVIFFEAESVKYDIIEFYENKIVKKWGWLSKHEEQNVLIAIPQVEIHQSLIGRIFNYGHVYVDFTGKWDKNIKFVKNPFGLKNYLQPRISKSAKGVSRMVHD